MDKILFELCLNFFRFYPYFVYIFDINSFYPTFIGIKSGLKDMQFRYWKMTDIQWVWISARVWTTIFLTLDSVLDKLFLLYQEVATAIISIYIVSMIICIWVKVPIFWEGHKILRNLHLTFDWHYIGQKLGGDFAKFFGLLRIYELYHIGSFITSRRFFLSNRNVHCCIQ